MTKVDLGYFTAHYDAELDAIVETWVTSPTSEEFRTGMNKIIDLMAKHKTGALLGDTKELGALSEEDQQWSFTDWLARALEVGYHSFAVIISPDIFAQMSVEDTLTEVQAKTKVTIQYFDD
ncbi:MAG: hypothetical protein ACLFQ0_20950, partial [Cyclobacteriaceae bacterium]